MMKQYDGYVIHVLLPAGSRPLSVLAITEEWDATIKYLGGDVEITGPFPFTDDGGRE